MIEKTDAKPAASMHAGHDLLSKTHHDPRTHGQMTITLIEALGTLLNVDVTTTKLHLKDHIDERTIDNLTSSPNDTCTGIFFAYHDLQITCCSCGEILIYGPLEKHEAGSTDAQASMR